MRRHGRQGTGAGGSTAARPLPAAHRPCAPPAALLHPDPRHRRVAPPARSPQIGRAALTTSSPRRSPVSPARRWVEPGHAAPAARVRTLGICIIALAAAAAWSPVAAQNGPAVPDPAAAVDRPEHGPGSANYRLAARWAPYKIDKLIYSTTVNPRWIESTERFWYEWRTSAGTFYYIVDPVRGTKRQIFDNDRIAAELTRITRDPWDGQHLPIRNIRFIDANTLRFEVQSSQDEEVEERQDTVQTEQRLMTRASRPRPRTRKKVHHFEYDVNTQDRKSTRLNSSH